MKRRASHAPRLVRRCPSSSAPGTCSTGTPSRPSAARSSRRWCSSRPPTIRTRSACRSCRSGRCAARGLERDAGVRRGGGAAEAAERGARQAASRSSTTASSARRSPARRTRSSSRRRCAPVGEDSIVLNPRSFRRAEAKKLELDLRTRLEWARERRVCQAVRAETDGRSSRSRTSTRRVSTAAAQTSSCSGRPTSRSRSPSPATRSCSRATSTSAREPRRRSKHLDGVLGADSGHRPGARQGAEALGTERWPAGAAHRRRPPALRPRAGRDEVRVTFEEARAQFPVLERLAYLNAGTNGPLAARDGRGDGRPGAGATSSRAAAGRRTSSACSSCATRCAREARRAASASPPEQRGAHDLDDGRLQHRARGLGLGPDDEVVTTDGEHFGLLGALARLGRARARRARPGAAGRGGARRDAARGDAADAAARALARLLDRPATASRSRELKAETGLPVLVDGAQSAGAIPVDASRRSTSTPSRARSGSAGRTRPAGSYVARPRAAAASRRRATSSQDELRADRRRSRPRPGAARFDPGWIAAAVARGPRRGARRCAPEWRFERAAASGRALPRAARASASRS